MSHNYHPSSSSSSSSSPYQHWTNRATRIWSHIDTSSRTCKTPILALIQIKKYTLCTYSLCVTQRTFSRSSKALRRGVKLKRRKAYYSRPKRDVSVFFVILLLLILLSRASNKKVLLKDFPSGSNGGGRRIMPIISVKTEPSLHPPNVSQETAKTETSWENASKNDCFLYRKFTSDFCVDVQPKISSLELFP